VIVPPGLVLRATNATVRRGTVGLSVVSHFSGCGDVLLSVPVRPTFLVEAVAFPSPAAGTVSNLALTVADSAPLGSFDIELVGTTSCDIARTTIRVTIVP
jgi:hypothetical protein